MVTSRNGDGKTVVVGPEDYDWLVVHRGGHAELWTSRLSVLSRAHVVIALRDVADRLEGTL